MSGNELKLAVFTLLSGVGIVNVFPKLPTSLINVFDNHVGRIAILVMLLIQSGRSVSLSIVVSVVFYVAIWYWVRRSDGVVKM